MTQTRDKSAALYARAETLMPGGVNSPVRAFGAVDGTPVFFKSAKGAEVETADGDTVVDFCMGFGPQILGHADERIVQAVAEAAAGGMSYGACHAGEADLAERVLAGFPWAGKVRLVNSGTEAVLTAVRLARGVTGRNKIVKFNGGYHGHLDAMLVKAGSGLATQGIASSAGVSASVAADTLVADLDDRESVEALFKAHGDDIAAVVIEPLPANNGLLIQRPAFLQFLRDITTKHGAMLVFDEVISGFRLHYGGMGDLVDVTPDIVTLGKIIGGGAPVGALIATADTMNHLAPLGPVYQAGTLSGNPLAVAAGITTLDILRTTDGPDGDIYARLEAFGQRVEDKIAAAALPNFQVVRKGSLMWFYFSDEDAPRRADHIDANIATRFSALHRALLGEGLYLPPSAYEVAFLSSAHTDAHIDRLIAAVQKHA